MTQPNLFDDEVADELFGAVSDLVARHGFKAVLYEVERHRPVRSVPSAPARHADPATSHAAAKTEADVSRFRGTSRQAKLLAVFAAGDYTDQQAAIRVVGIHASPSAFDGCRRRCSDLRAAGLLFDTGKRRKNTGSDDESIVWGATHAGRDALVKLAETGWSR